MLSFAFANPGFKSIARQRAPTRAVRFLAPSTGYPAHSAPLSKM
jgi:hypothetical protein